MTPPTRLSPNRFAGPDDLAPDSWHPQVRAAADWLLQNQHPIRGWEYSQATEHLDTAPKGSVLDVGGAGSHFLRYMRLRAADTHHAYVCCDPALGGEVRQVEGLDLWPFPLAEAPALNFQRVSCLSVIEHMPLDYVTDEFLPDLAAHVRPGGRLILTFDATPTPVRANPDGTKPAIQDPFHFHWMRKWIATPMIVLDRILPALRQSGLILYGGPFDSTNRGTAVYDYTAASLRLVRV